MIRLGNPDRDTSPVMNPDRKEPAAQEARPTRKAVVAVRGSAFALLLLIAGVLWRCRSGDAPRTSVTAEPPSVAGTAPPARTPLQDEEAPQSIPRPQSGHRPRVDAYTSGILLARAHVAAGRLKAAADLYGELSRRFPADKDLPRLQRQTEVALSLAHIRALRDAGELDDAQRAARELIDQGSAPYDAGVLYLQLALARHDLDAASDALEALVQQYPQDAELADLRERIRLRREIAAARGHLDARENRQAFDALSDILARHPESDEAGALLARLLEARGQLDEARDLLTQLAARFPADVDFPVQRARVQEQIELRRATQALREGRSQLALEIAQPVFQSGQDRYTAGLLLAHALDALHRHTEAAEVYGALAARYPQDPDLVALQIAQLVQARNPAAARTLFDRLDGEARRAALAALNGDLSTLYGNRAWLSTSQGSGSNGYGREATYGIGLSVLRENGTFTVDAEQAERFGKTSAALGGQYAFGLSQGVDGAIGLRASPEGLFLPRFAADASLGWTTSVGRLSLSARHMRFDNSQATVIAPGLDLPVSAGFELRGRVYYVPQTSAYSILLAPRWTDHSGNVSSIILTGGQAGEQLGTTDAILRTPTYGARVLHDWRIGPRLTLDGELYFEHRSGLYDRTGASLALSYGW